MIGGEEFLWAGGGSSADWWVVLRGEQLRDQLAARGMNVLQMLEALSKLENQKEKQVSEESRQFFAAFRAVLSLPPLYRAADARGHASDPIPSAEILRDCICSHAGCGTLSLAPRWCSACGCAR